MTRLNQQQPTYVCTLKSQTNPCYLVHKRVQPFCLALNQKTAVKGWKKAAGICAVPVADHQMKTWMLETFQTLVQLAIFRLHLRLGQC